MNQLSLADDAKPPDYGDDNDFWATPPDAVAAIRPILREALYRRGTQESFFSALEPAVGEGALIETLIVEARPWRLATCEIDPVRAATMRKSIDAMDSDYFRCEHIVADFLTLDVEKTWPGLTTTQEHPLLVLMNPPWTKPRKTIGREFVKRCLELAAPTRGIVCSLLQADWCTGVEWGRLHDKYEASFYPLRRRPSFDGSGKSGMRPAAWFLFDFDNPRREWRVIG